MSFSALFPSFFDVQTSSFYAKSCHFISVMSCYVMSLISSICPMSIHVFISPFDVIRSHVARRFIHGVDSVLNLISPSALDFLSSYSTGILYPFCKENMGWLKKS